MIAKKHKQAISLYNVALEKFRQHPAIFLKGYGKVQPVSQKYPKVYDDKLCWQAYRFDILDIGIFGYGSNELPMQNL